MYVECTQTIHKTMQRYSKPSKIRHLGYVLYVHCKATLYMQIADRHTFFRRIILSTFSSSFCCLSNCTLQSAHHDVQCCGAELFRRLRLLLFEFQLLTIETHFVSCTLIFKNLGFHIFTQCFLVFFIIPFSVLYNVLKSRNFSSSSAYTVRIHCPHTLSALNVEIFIIL